MRPRKVCNISCAVVWFLTITLCVFLGNIFRIDKPSVLVSILQLNYFKNTVLNIIRTNNSRKGEINSLKLALTTNTDSNAFQESSRNGIPIEKWSAANNFLSRKVILQKFAFNHDPDCRNYSKALYKERTFHLTPLVSYPGSGNTWTRHLIELSSGIFTGSIYMDLDLLVRGFVGEKEPWDSGSTIVQKMHTHFTNDLNVSQAILLIRDPYKAIVSFVQYLESGHLGQASVHTFRKKEWPLYILKETYKWISFAKSWIEAPVDLIIIYYENLKMKATNIKELEKMCHFLRIPCHNLYTKCFQNHKEGLFHRTRKLLVEPSFPTWVRNKVNRGIDYLNKLLIKHGHPKLPLHRYTHYKD